MSGGIGAVGLACVFHVNDPRVFGIDVIEHHKSKPSLPYLHANRRPFTVCGSFFTIALGLNPELSIFGQQIQLNCLQRKIR